MAWYSMLPAIVAQAAAAPAAAPEAAGGGDELSVALRLIAAVGVIASSFVLGTLIARGLRMPEYSFKIGLVLFVLIASLAINIVGWPPKRGIDLSGGVVLVYEVEQGAGEAASLATVLTRLNEELNLGGEKLEARPNARNQIEIVVPEGVDADRVRAAVREVQGSDESVQLVSAGERRQDGQTVYLYDFEQTREAVDMPKLVQAVSRRINPGGVKELTIRQYGAEQLEVIVPEVEKAEVEQIKRLISTSGVLEFRIVANTTDDNDIIRAGDRTPGRDVYIGGRQVGRWVRAADDLRLPPEAQASFRETESHGREVLVRIDPFNVDGSYLRRAGRTFDQAKLAVSFTFNSIGGEKFGQLTSKNLPDPATGFSRHLGIILDGEMLSAPSINSTIYDSGIITGNFTDEEVDFLIGVLNAGSLPATLQPEPISEQRISSQLGDDTIRKGALSIAISTAAILVFMVIYYRFCGMVADVAVVLNMVVTVAVMILIKAAFTLPGLAGLVLTVGMAVDANVLIYERMREESERGASLRMAIRNGYARAMSTIIDSHVTTLISGIVLYIVGTDQIKGFAVTLVIGLLMSLFTAVYVSRVIFDIAEKKRWLTRLNMMHLIGHTNYDFIRWRGPAIAVSMIIIVVGVVASGARGLGLLDIDFTGGSSVQIQFAEGKARDIGAVRKAVEELPDVAVSSVGENDLEFKIDTSNPDIDAVEKLLQEKFGGALETYSMEYGPVAKIEAAKPEGPEGAAGGVELNEPRGDAPAEPGDKEEAKSAVPAKPQSNAESPHSEPAKPDSTEEATSEAASDKPAEGEDAPQDDAPPEPPGDAPAEQPESSQIDRRRSRTIELAAADASQALAAIALAQAEPPAGAEAAEKPASEPEPAADAEPADAPAEPTDKPAESPPTDEAKAATEPPASAPAETSPAMPAGELELGPGTPDSAALMAGGSRVTLEFPHTIAYRPLREMIDQELASMNLVNVNYELTNPKYKPGSDLPLTEWTLDIMLDAGQTSTLVKAMQKQLASTPVFPSSNQIGGKVAGDTQLIAMYALLASMAIIVVYVWFRFENLIFGLAAVLALVHDVAVTIAFLAISAYVSPYLGFLLVDPFKISLAVVAALLTIVGFSINDTIVIFDRIREVRGKSPGLTADMINRSVNQTLSRTFLTSGTVLIASIILYAVGGPGIHAFAFAMVVGVIVGTYSTIYIAAPVLLWLKRPGVAEQKPAKSASARGVSSERLPKPS